MDVESWYDDSARERWVSEPPKRVAAPVRRPFERDKRDVVLLLPGRAREAVELCEQPLDR